jgi:hypothetical protein
MKNYYKRPDKEQRIMIDNESNYVVILYPGTIVKSINIVTTEEVINQYTVEVSNNTLWVETTETDFNDKKNEIISAI